VPPEPKTNRVLEALLNHPELALAIRERLLDVQFITPWEFLGDAWVRRRNLSIALWHLHQGYAEEVSIAALVVPDEAGMGLWTCCVYRHHSDEPAYQEAFATEREAKRQADNLLKGTHAGNPLHLPRTYFIAS
jgi:hypothetical protein